MLQVQWKIACVLTNGNGPQRNDLLQTSCHGQGRGLELSTTTFCPECASGQKLNFCAKKNNRQQNKQHKTSENTMSGCVKALHDICFCAGTRQTSRVKKNIRMHYMKRLVFFWVLGLCCDRLRASWFSRTRFRICWF